jgi:hypothetical protein
VNFILDQKLIFPNTIFMVVAWEILSFCHPTRIQAEYFVEDTVCTVCSGIASCHGQIACDDEDLYER